LARTLRSEYGKQQLALGKGAWLSPNIRFLNDWLTSTINSVADTVPIVLNGHASKLLWEKCLGDQSGDRLLNTGGLARQARQAWHQLHEWRVPLEEVSDSARSDDEKLFASAARQYRTMLADNGWIDGAQAGALVAELVASGAVAAPTALIHSGFDRITPLVEHLFSALADGGCAISPAREDNYRDKTALADFDDTEAELRAAGAWARRCVSSDPSARIGIIHLALDKQAAAAERFVREGLVPGWQYGDDAVRTAVNVSYGRPLSAYPAIAVALLALRWLHRGLSFGEISLLLRSQFIAGEELTGRCKLELYLRRWPDQSWLPGAIVRLLKDQAEEADAIGWLEYIERLDKLRLDAPRHASPIVWAKTIDDLMQSLRWPGAGTLASDEFQLINRWRELLNELAQLDVVCPQMTFPEAIGVLTALANDTIFQPERKSAVVQLLGPLEAAGMRFDSLWIAGLDGDAWPPVAHPLALVSRQLQKRYSMPNAVPDDTLEYSRRVLNRLARSAENVRLSWARSVDDAERTASPLIERLDASADPAATDPGWHAAALVNSMSFEHVGKDKAPAVQEPEALAGGAYTVQRQARNPFSAFAFGRLGIAEIDSVVSGLSPKMRGSLLHAALHALYADKPSQADIRQWIGSDARNRISDAVEKALKRYRWQADAVLRRILALEQDRLCDILYEFVVAETGRSTFQVESVERDLDYHQFGVRLKIRPDRVDRLADDSLLIADYKTGLKKNLLDRSGDIKDLQLAVYACAHNDNVGALALINVGSRSIDYDSAGGSEEWDAKRADQWPDRLRAWRERVARATQQIAAGDVRINLNLKTADARPLNILCRFEEKRRAG
ncbi:MAG: PD-(D/E)XK nuclease family protein, partial [Woeseiaceae bacterium]